MVMWEKISSFNGNSIKNYNSFSPLLNHVECFKCNNIGNKACDCRSNTLTPPNQIREECIIRNRNQIIKVWRRKQENQEEMV